MNCDQYDFAVFVPATSVEEVKDIAENGLCMPPKSAYFHPKALIRDSYSINMPESIRPDETLDVLCDEKVRLIQKKRVSSFHGPPFCSRTSSP